MLGDDDRGKRYRDDDEIVDKGKEEGRNSNIQAQASSLRRKRDYGAARWPRGEVKKCQNHPWELCWLIPSAHVLHTLFLRSKIFRFSDKLVD